MIKVLKNTFPVLEWNGKKLPHAEPGDVCEWQRTRHCYNLVRLSDNATVFCSININKDDVSPTTLQPPILVGVIGENKRKGYILIVEHLKRNNYEFRNI